MPEYRIVAKIDPSGTVQGAAKVKQELAGIETAARRTGDTQKRSNDQTSNSFKNLATAIGQAVRAQKDAEAAAARVEAEVDQEAAALRRLNGLLKDAELAHRAGALSSANYAKVQKMANDGLAQTAAVSGRARAGLTQLSFQVGDVAQGMALGTRASTIFAQQSGQVIQSLQVMGGEGNKFLQFLSGPWGIGLATAAVVLGPFIGKLFESSDATKEATESLRKDAEESANADRAKQIFANTLEGVTDAILRNRKALDQMNDADKTAARRALESAIASQMRLKALRNETQALLDNAEAHQQRNLQLLGGVTSEAGRSFAAEDLPRTQEAIARLRKSLSDTDAQIIETDKQVTEALGRRVVEMAESQATAMGRIKQKYEGRGGLIDLARQSATAEEVRNGALSRQIKLLQQRQQAEEKAAQEAARVSRSGDGVQRFRTRQQAIGIAGRELQQAGLRVDGNEQFGRTTGHANDADHNKFAIDVNVGKGVVEARVPDLKRRFDQLALAYQRRGFDVIWNGQKYPAFGNGPSGPAKGHDNHLHIYAAQTIVGHATHSSDFAQELREAKQEQTTAEQKSDFVQQIVDRASARGLPQNRRTALQSSIDSAVADYTRRFNGAPSDDERKKIVGALTEADAREQAEHFRTAYVVPLEEMSDALGQTGLARQIAIKQQEEERAKGAALTEVEKQQIANSVLMTDQLDREARVLEEINAPVETYRQQLAALVDLLQKGSISQEQFNARVADLQGPARQVLAGMPADQIDPSSGMSYGQISQTAEEQARYAQQLADLQTNRQALIDMGLNYDALEEAAHQAHIQKLNEIDQARKSTQLMAASQTFESLAQIAEAGLGKQNAIYKAMFVASKAFAIADAVVKIQQGIAQALSLPFPANIPAIAQVAALGASIVSNIQAVAANFADGGYVSGPGGPRADAIPANLSNGEFVVNASATSRNRSLLEAINAGSPPPRAPAGGGAAGMRPLMVKVENHAPGVEYETQRGASEDEITVIARRVVRAEAPAAVARDMATPNSKTSKAVERNFTTSRKRR